MPTSADVLANTGKLSIQKSQQGGGSPVIRGFEASRILLLVDGVRMNNLIYRAGHLQNSITVDKNMLEKVDVLFGPSSTIFGSDALGGAIYLQTKSAKLLSQIDNKKWSGNLMSNYSTVNEGKSAHVDLKLCQPAMGFFIVGFLQRVWRSENGKKTQWFKRLFWGTPFLC